MASFPHFWVLALFLITVLRGSQSCGVVEDLSSFLPATRKLLDHPALIGKNSVLDNGMWCVAKDGVPDAKLQSNLDYACSQGADCSAIQPGHPCFEPNTLPSHASYAMNSYFQSHGKTTDACGFDGTGITTDKDPSTPSCKYPG